MGVHGIGVDMMGYHAWDRRGYVGLLVGIKPTPVSCWYTTLATTKQCTGVGSIPTKGPSSQLQILHMQSRLTLYTKTHKSFCIEEIFIKS
jgi:hypothetical protein